MNCKMETVGFEPMRKSPTGFKADRARAHMVAAHARTLARQTFEISGKIALPMYAHAGVAISDPRAFGAGRLQLYVQMIPFS